MLLYDIFKLEHANKWLISSLFCANVCFPFKIKVWIIVYTNHIKFTAHIFSQDRRYIELYMDKKETERESTYCKGTRSHSFQNWMVFTGKIFYY